MVNKTAKVVNERRKGDPRLSSEGMTECLTGSTGNTGLVQFKCVKPAVCAISLHSTMNESRFLNYTFVADISIKADVFISLSVILEI